MSADVYRLPSERGPKPEPRSFGYLTIDAIRKNGDECRIELSGKDQVPILTVKTTLDVASTLRIGMGVKLVLEEDLWSV